MSNDGPVAVLAGFTVGARDCVFTEQQRARVCDAITDALGVSLAGAAEPSVQRAVQALGRGDEGMFPVLGRSERFSVGTAAVINGLAIHAIDFDDTAHPGYAHPSAVLLPTLLAVDGLCGPLEGRLATDAYIVGLEVLNVLGRLLNPEHYQNGWHATATLGTFAGTAAASYAMRLDERQTRTAFSIAASMAGGVRANFGTMVKPLHAGLAARAAIESAALAASGFTAASDALEGPSGFLHAAGSSSLAVEPLRAALGDPWEIDSAIGLALKPYPACGATHPGIEAAARLRDRLGSRPVRVRVGVTGLSRAVLVFERPRNGLEAKFSQQYTVAAALARGELGLDDFEDGRVAAVVAQGLLDPVTVAVDERVKDSTEFATIVQVETEDGQQAEDLVPLARGKPERWPTEEEQRRKFDVCAARHPSADADRQWEAARRLLSGGDLRSITRAFASP